MTQAEAVLEYLKAGNSVSELEAPRLFNLTCLAQVIHQLRKMGCNIKTDMIDHSGLTPDGQPCKKRYARYRYAYTPQKDLFSCVA
jgi:hypothetical protein